MAVIFPGNEAAKSVYARLGMKAQRRSIHAYDQYLPYYVIDQGDFRY
jgi:hypothetical protein